MRDIDPVLAERLAGGVTSFARCWLLTRSDGATLGFTEHDRALVVNGVTCTVTAGMEPADTESQLGFAVGGGEVAGVLAAPSLTEQDLSAGRYDDAQVETWLVDWEDPARKVLLDRGTLGDVRRAGSAFVAELRGVAHRLDQQTERLFEAHCSADLGDRRCGVDLGSRGMVYDAVVGATDGRLVLRLPALQGLAEGSLVGGRLSVRTGDNAGYAVEVRSHRRASDAAELGLWHPTPMTLRAGDGVRVTPGCDKRFETCRDRFGNVVNFRGFPHMPGNDYVMQSARDGSAGMDGGSLFR
ncbi:MAG: DUF2163 domain-containing protein [Alsobacter sp.]